MSTRKPPDPSKVIFISDTHRNAEVSNFKYYEEQLKRRMGEYGHVVLIGDIFELLYFKKPEGDMTAKNYVKSQIEESIAWLKNFMDENPECKVHFILGNHENVRRFRNRLDKLWPHDRFFASLGDFSGQRALDEAFNPDGVAGANEASNPDEIIVSNLDKILIDKKYRGQFEWSPEAIRLGDALITHGHLMMDDTIFFPDTPVSKTAIYLPDSQIEPARLRHAHAEGGWTDFYRLVDSPGQAVANRLRKPKNVVSHMYDLLREWAAWPLEENWFSYVHKGDVVPFTSTDWVKHVFFGHTHVKFHNHAYKGILWHNTGAFTEVKSRRPEDLGVLEAELKDDKIINVRPVLLEPASELSAKQIAGGWVKRWPSI